MPHRLLFGIKAIAFAYVKGIEADGIVFAVSEVIALHHVAKSFITMPHIHQHDMRTLLIIAAYHVVGEK